MRVLVTGFEPFGKWIDFTEAVLYLLCSSVTV